ncbi:MAG: galactose-1-phosphate uridylyltransferase [Candidatus Goldbacteria bacterium]|nr:galactose-1-phosphate uridylyltransferase [Candidatus Goldiibacteriota bacterium]
MSEIRRDPITNRWIITLDDKYFNPSSVSSIPIDLPQIDKNCPFCPGNDSKISKVIFELKDKNDGWKIKVIPNNRPYLMVEKQLKKQGRGIFDVISGTGANEVIIENPLHNIDIDKLDIQSISDIIKTYINRTLDLKKDIRFEYIFIFKNRGPDAGGTLFHPYSQLIALPVIPKRISEEIESSLKYFELKNRCIFCDIIDNELLNNERVVKETENYVVITPFASRVAFELCILPKFHSTHFYNLNEQQISELSTVLKDVIYRLNKSLNNPSYNYMIHTAPVKSEEIPYYHWHIEIMPRIKRTEGFEWGTGFYINPTLPEDVAEYLRKI